jgi:hypothetical protein
VGLTVMVVYRNNFVTAEAKTVAAIPPVMKDDASEENQEIASITLSQESSGGRLKSSETEVHDADS